MARLTLHAAFAALTLAVAATAARAETITLQAGETTRSVEVLAPGGGTRIPLLVLLHGRFGTGAHLLREAGIRPQGFVVAAPDGYRRSWASGRGGTPADRNGVDDVAFLRLLVATMAARYGADPARVYVAGMSNGGFMAARLACEAPDLVAGIAIVGATTGQGIGPGCRPPRPISVLFIHGTADPLIRTDGTGPRAVGLIMGIRQAVHFWARRAGCTAAAPPRALPHAGEPDGTAAWRTDYAPCTGGGRVALIEVRGGGHVWPGGTTRLPERIVGPTTNAVDAGSEILAFFGLARN